MQQHSHILDINTGEYASGERGGREGDKECNNNLCPSVKGPVWHTNIEDKQNIPHESTPKQPGKSAQEESPEATLKRLDQLEYLKCENTRLSEACVKWQYEFKLQTKESQTLTEV